MKLLYGLITSEVTSVRGMVQDVAVHHTSPRRDLVGA